MREEYNIKKNEITIEIEAKDNEINKLKQDIENLKKNSLVKYNIASTENKIAHESFLTSNKLLESSISDNDNIMGKIRELNKYIELTKDSIKSVECKNESLNYFNV